MAATEISDITAFIRERLNLIPVPTLPQIRLYTAHPGSGLWRLDPTGDGPAPYWAYPWGGGLVLARYLADRPETVRGRRVMDLGAGSGLVGIVAARAGAATVTAAEIDRNGIAAIGLNAVANEVTIAVTAEDLLEGPAPDNIDLVLVGDLYYDPDVALRTTRFLDRCLAAGIDVLIGDPGRAHLPYERLRPIAQYDVPDFGGKRDVGKPSAVYELMPPHPQ